MSKIELKKVLGNNIQDFANNIDENFSRISENGIWRGEKGESYTEKTITLWSQDETSGNIAIVSEQILKTLFTESDGSASDWDTVKGWTVSDPDKFLSLGIPKEWNMYPGYPLYYSQPTKCFKYFNASGVGKDWSGMVAVIGEDTYRRYDLLPRLYVDPVSGNYCWMINGVKTGVAASVNPDAETRNIRLYLIRNDADGLKYFVADGNNVIWTDIPDTQPRVGDFAWRLSTKTVTSGGENKDAQVLEVCIFNGIEWSAATVDENNSNFFITYDDAVMTYIWQHIYSDLGDTYTDSLDASNIHSFQFPVKNDKGENESNKTHKITSKSFNNGHRSDLLIEAPGDAGSYTYSKLVISGYEDVVLAKPTINDKGELVYKGDSLIKRCKTIMVEDMNKIDFGEIDNGQLFCIDRCYWRNTAGADQWCLSVTETVDGATMYHTRNYVRYVFLKAYICDDDVVWDTHGIGVTLTGKEKSNIYTSEGEEGYTGGVFEVGFKQVTNSAKYSDNPGKIYNNGTETSIDWTKFGVITEMRDPVNGNYTNFDFLQGNAFRRYHDGKYDYKLSPGLRMDSNYCRYRDVFSNNRIIMDYPGTIHGLYDGFIGVMDDPSDFDGISFSNCLVSNNTIEGGRAFILATRSLRNNVGVCNNKIINSGYDETTDNIINKVCYIYSSGGLIENCNIQNSTVKLEVYDIKDTDINNCVFNNIIYFKDKQRVNYEPGGTSEDYIMGYLSGRRISIPGDRANYSSSYELSEGADECIEFMIVDNCKFNNIKTYTIWDDTVNSDSTLPSESTKPMDLCVLGAGYANNDTAVTKRVISNFNLNGNILAYYHSYKKTGNRTSVTNYYYYINATSVNKPNNLFKNNDKYGGIIIIGIYVGSGGDQLMITSDGMIAIEQKHGVIGSKNENYVISKSTYSTIYDSLVAENKLIPLSQLKLIDDINYSDKDSYIVSLYSEGNGGSKFNDSNNMIYIPLFNSSDRVACISSYFGIHSKGQTKSLTTLLSQ